ncbi:hypothetical protein DPEC_G00307070 [Dallia pectoralis]|uniref:Uncharacterized protein n=1 Tax=Dallia pectoralis TaxID=75939 RepID=A0ACC2FEA2_DALPE|nr:hypothetical protein DPEC_G00307070 [Dallia pectoralis]
MFSDTPDQGLATDVQQLDEIGDIKVDPVVVNPICSASPPSPSGPRDQPVKDCLEMKDLMSSLLQDVCEAKTMVLPKEGGPSSTPRKGKRRFRENMDGLYSDRMEPERSKWNQGGLYSDRMETKRSKWNQARLYSYRMETERSKGDQEDLYSYSKYKEMFNKNLEVFHANIVQPKRSRKNQEDLRFHLSGSRKRKREDVKTPQTFTYSKRSKD